jgi:hypothetical protein
MPFLFFERTRLDEHAKQLSLSTYVPELFLSELATGVDNVRHDVYLSPKFIELLRGHMSYLIARHGDVEDLVRVEAPRTNMAGVPMTMRLATPAEPKPADRAGELKKSLSDLQIAALNFAKSEGNISIDLLLRLAIIKLIRQELTNQFAEVIERCRTKLKTVEGPRADTKVHTLRDRFLNLQVSKKTVFRKVSQDLFATLREVEKEGVARMRRSLFGETDLPAYELFLNRLVFTEDGHDDYLNAEHYVMLGNYDRDPDRFHTLQEITSDFLQEIGFAQESDGDPERCAALLNVPENAHELLGGGTAQEDSIPRAKAQRALLAAWTNGLDQAGVLGHIIASYETASLLAEYSLINPQQLKNALISKTDRKRVEELLAAHSRISLDKLNQAVKRVDGHGSADRQRVAARFLFDFMRYHRDLHRMDVVNTAIESVNIILNERLRELSTINNTLYEFLLPEEQKPAEEKIVHHVILKADIRDSTTLTRTLFERGLNPASYFSLNFYDPINKLLPKYNAAKVFIEGDAVILALFERENETAFGVSRTCMLAREMLGIVSAYNEKSQQAGLPSLELGIGICFQDSAPMYLMDGNSRIMISAALNESDRLSGCHKGARQFVGSHKLPFNVFCFKTIADEDTAGNPDEFLIRYNIGGIHINRAAFDRMRAEISLREHVLQLPMIWGPQKVRFYSGLVPVATGVFHPIVVREGIIPHINATDFTVKSWTDRRYYEVCTNEAVYEMIGQAKGAGA